MKKIISLTEEQAVLLEKLIDYVYENEAENFEEYCDDGGEKEDHIYYAAVKLNSIL